MKTEAKKVTLEGVAEQADGGAKVLPFKHDAQPKLVPENPSLYELVNASNRAALPITKTEEVVAVANFPLTLAETKATPVVTTKEIPANWHKKGMVFLKDMAEVASYLTFTFPHVVQGWIYKKLTGEDIAEVIKRGQPNTSFAVAGIAASIVWLGTSMISLAGLIGSLPCYFVAGAFGYASDLKETIPAY